MERKSPILLQIPSTAEGWLQSNFRKISDELNAGVALNNKVSSPTSGLSATTGMIKISSHDSVPDFVEMKLLAGTGITFTKGHPNFNETLLISAHVPVTLATNHGLGLSGQVLNMGTPSTCTNVTTNAVTTTTHTHAITGFLTAVTAHNVLSTTHGDSTAGSATAGDIIYADATPKWTRLAKAADGKVLTLVSGLPSWETAGGGGSHVILSATHTDTTISAPNDNDVLTWDAGTSKWIAKAGGGGGMVAHALDGAYHTVSGLTTGHFLKALSATTFGFAAHGLTYSDVGALAVGGTAADSDKLDGQHAAAFLTSVTAHDLLSATHGDTTASAVTRGDIIIGSGASPKWDNLAVGASTTYLAGGTEPSWATLNQAAVDDLMTTDSPQFVTVKLTDLTDDYIPYHVNDATGLANGPTKTNVDSAISLKHAAVTLAADHGLGLTGQVLNMGTPSTLTAATTNAVTTTTHTHAITGFLTGVTAHNMLSTTHGDTLADSVVAGDIMYGNATPKWARLPKGTDGWILTLVAGLPAWAVNAASYTDEMAQDAVGAMIGTSLQYVDATPLLDTIQDIRTSASPTFAGITLHSTVLSAPSAPVISNVGTPGVVTWAYKVTAILADGTETGLSLAGTTTTGNATLNTSNYNHLAWSAYTGAISYRIFRTTAGGTPNTTGLISCLFAASTTLDDKGIVAADNISIPTASRSGLATIDVLRVGPYADDPSAKLGVEGCISAHGSVRSTGVDDFFMTGSGLEMQYVSGVGHLISFDRDTGLFTPLVLNYGTTYANPVIVGNRSASDGAHLFIVNGTSGFYGKLDIVGEFTAISDSANTSTVATYNNDPNTFAFLNINRSRGTIASPSNVVANDMLGGVNYYGNIGGAFHAGAAIVATVESVAAGVAGLLDLITYKNDATPGRYLRLTNTGAAVGEFLGTPGAAWDVVGSGSTGGVLRLTNTNASATANDVIGTVEYYTMDGDGAHVGAYVTAIQDPVEIYGRASALLFGTNTVSTAVAERMRISSVGHVGIGVAAPLARLHVGVTGSYASTIIERTDSGKFLGFLVGAGSSVINFDDSAYLSISKQPNANKGTNASMSELVRFGATGNVKIAGTAIRGTTEGTGHLDIFDATAPVGTLANGISIYSEGGVPKIMNAAGDVVSLTTSGSNIGSYVPRPSYKRMIGWYPMLNNVGVYGSGASTGGTLSESITDGFVMGKLTTTGTSGNAANIYSTQFFHQEQNPDITMYLKTGSAVTTCRLLFGMFSSMTTCVADDPKTAHYALLSYRSVIGSTWQLYTSNGSTSTSTDTGITVTADTWYTLRVWTTDGGTTWNASVNGNAVNTTSTVPAATSSYAGFQVNISAASARHLYWKYWEAMTT